MQPTDEKRHYKSYKAGKRWLYASITVLTLGLGTATLSETACADTGEATPTDTTVVAATPKVAAVTDEVSESPAVTEPATPSKVPVYPEPTETTPTPDPTTDTNDTPTTPTGSETPVNTPATPAVVEDPNQTSDIKDQQTIVADTSITATNDTGTITGGQPSSPGNQVVLDQDARDITLNLSITNRDTTGNAKNASFVFGLPQGMNADKSNLKVSQDIDWSFFTDQLPAGWTVKYGLKYGQYATQEELLAQHPDFTFDQLGAVWFVGALNPGEALTWNVPMTLDKTMTSSTNTVQIYGAGDGVYQVDSLNIGTTQITPEPVTGHTVYRVVLSHRDPANPNHWLYTQAPEWLQAQMPVVSLNDLQTMNFWSEFSITDPIHLAQVMNGGYYIVDNAGSGIGKIAGKNGYSVLVANNLPTNALSGFQLTPEALAEVLDATGGTGQTIEIDGVTYQISDMYFAKLSQEIDATGAELTVGDTWDPADSLLFVNPNNNAHAITVAPADAAGLLTPVIAADGTITYRAAKAGTLQVTYHYGAFSKTITVTIAPTDEPGQPETPGTGGGQPENPGTGGTTAPGTDETDPVITPGTTDNQTDLTPTTPATDDQTSITPGGDSANVRLTDPTVGAKPDQATSPQQAGAAVTTQRTGQATTPASAVTVTKLATTATHSQKSAATTLPQTGERTTTASLGGAILLALAAIGLVDLRKHRA